MKSLFIKNFSIIFFVLFNINSYAQISHGGKPYASHDDISQIEYLSYLNSQVEEIENDNEKDIRLKPFRFANMIDVNLNIKEIGKSIKVDGGTLYLAGIVSTNAYSIYPVFSEFHLSGNSHIFIYNPGKSHILGKFTSENNKPENILAVMPIIGDTLIIELFESDRSYNLLRLGQIGHDFVGLSSYLNKTKDGNFGQSGDCNVDINCFEGNNWQSEKHSVCRIITNGSLCTGTLINNTNIDARPFFLTANHCINSQSLANEMLVVFNYESPVCDGPDGSVEQSISGGIMRATTHHLDFCLVELTEPPLPSYNPYFAGWNNSDSVEGLTTCIHHPQGDVKKISYDAESPTTSNYGAGYDFESHWLIGDWESGTTEGGSSGSPLFDKYHRIVGDLTGGEANCTNSINDYYSKFHLAWDSYSNNDDQLKYWLDPANTGQTAINGYDPYHGHNAPVANFTSNRTNILEGSTIDFTDLSTGNASSWNWTFTGANPSQSSDQHPQSIKYTYSGSFKVKLEVSNSYGSDIIAYEGYVIVNDGCARFTNIEESEPMYLYAFSGNEWGYWTGHNQYGFTSFAEKFTNQSGNFVHGLYILPAKAYSGTSNSEIGISIWEGGGKPGNIIWSDNYEINSFTQGAWKYIEIIPAIETDGNFYIGYTITYNQSDTFAVPHAQPRGPGGLNTTFVKENNQWKAINEFSSELTISLALEPYLCGSLSSDEIIVKNKMSVYPNPSNGVVNFSLAENEISKRIQVVNSSGIIVYEESEITAINSKSISLSHLTPGVYILLVATETEIYSTKFQIIR